MWVPWALAAAFFVIGVLAARSDRFLHDEGMLSWFFAGIMAEEPVATLFFLKSRPPLALLYAPFASLGLDAFLVVHVLIAALAIPLVAAVARALDQRAPNLVALALAASPMFFASSASGVGNSDAITGFMLVLYLLVVRRAPAAAGVVAGALPLIRAEMSIFVIALALYCLARERRRFLLALPSVGLLFAVAGAFYHHDVLWFIHYPPTLMGQGEATPLRGAFGYAQASAGATVGVLLAIAPLLGLLALVPWRRFASLERVLLLASLVFVLAIRGFPIIGLFHFDDSPRYTLPMILALVPLGRLANVWLEEARDSRWWAAGILGLLWIAGVALDRSEHAPLLLVAVAAWALIWAAARRPYPRLALAMTAALGLGAAAAPPLVDATLLSSDQHARRHAVFAEWVATDPARVRSSRIITNVHLLSTWSRRHGLEGSGLTIESIISRDIEEELRTLTNEQSGQYATLISILHRHFYGQPLPADELRPELLHGDVVFVLESDQRLEAVMPSGEWEPLLTTLVERDGLRIAAFKPPDEHE